MLNSLARSGVRLGVRSLITALCISIVLSPLGDVYAQAISNEAPPATPASQTEPESATGTEPTTTDTENSSSPEGSGEEDPADTEPTRPRHRTIFAMTMDVRRTMSPTMANMGLRP